MNISDLWIRHKIADANGEYMREGGFIKALTEYQQGQWISVEERLPEKMQDILFTVVGVKNMKNEPIPPSVHYGWLDLANGFRPYIDPRDRWIATHWMPLPHAPSKGEAR